MEIPAEREGEGVKVRNIQKKGKGEKEGLEGREREQKGRKGGKGGKEGSEGRGVFSKETYVNR